MRKPTLLFLICLTFAVPDVGWTRTEWIANSGNWQSASNWSTGVPTATTYAVINQGQVALTTPGIAKSLNVNVFGAVNGAVVALNSTANLTVRGAATLGSASPQLSPLNMTTTTNVKFNGANLQVEQGPVEVGVEYTGVLRIGEGNYFFEDTNTTTISNVEIVSGGLSATSRMIIGEVSGTGRRARGTSITRVDLLDSNLTAGALFVGDAGGTGTQTAAIADARVSVTRGNVLIVTHNYVFDPVGVQTSARMIAVGLKTW